MTPTNRKRGQEWRTTESVSQVTVQHVGIPRPWPAERPPDPVFVGTWLPVPRPSSEWLVVLVSSSSTWLSLQRHTGEMLPCQAQREGMASVPFAATGGQGGPEPARAQPLHHTQVSPALDPTDGIPPTPGAVCLLTCPPPHPARALSEAVGSHRLLRGWAESCRSHTALPRKDCTVLAREESRGRAAGLWRTE